MNKHFNIVRIRRGSHTIDQGRRRLHGGGVVQVVVKLGDHRAEGARRRGAAADLQRKAGSVLRKARV